MTALAALATQQPQKLGDKIDSLYQLVQDKKAVDAESKAIGEEIRNLEHDLQDLMDGVGITSAKGLSASVSLTEQTVPKIDDWDLFWDYIKSEDASYMIQRRVTASAFNDLLKAGVEVPGVSPATIRKVNKRKVTK